MEQEFPRSDIPESEKDFDWCKKAVNYGVYIFEQRRTKNLKRMARLWNGYLGAIDKSSVRYLTNTYGKQNAIKFVDYRLTKQKIDLLCGEYLKLPISGTVYSVNKDAKSEKLERYQIFLGMSFAEDELTKLRKELNVVPFEGIPTPKGGPSNVWKSLSFKRKNEISMQYLVNYFIRQQKIKDHFSHSFLDLAVVAEGHGRIDEDEMGMPKFVSIDPRDRIFIESDRDMLCESSPVQGSRTRMFVPEIIDKYGHHLSKEDRDKIYGLQKEASEYPNNSNPSSQYVSRVDNRVAIDVFHVEWMTSTPYRRKVTPSDDPNLEPIKRFISDEHYQKDQAKIRRDVKNGKYTIETKWRTEWYEGVRIGGDVYVKDLCRKKPYQYVINDNPSKNYSDYVGLILMTRDGIRVSVQEVLENLSHVFNVIMFIINREISKIKGRVLAYDTAYLPKGKTEADILYGMTNDSIVFYNSSEDGRVGEGNVGQIPGFSSVDIGASNSLQVLINLKIDIQQTAERLSGLSDERMGFTPASATATNAERDREASNAVTYPMFYAMNRFEQTVLTRMVEKAKIKIASGGLPIANTILGDEVYNFIVASKDIGNDDYIVMVDDAKKNNDTKAVIRQYMSVALNNRELRALDALKVELADTLSESEGILQNAWETIKGVEQQQQQQALQAKQEQYQALIGDKVNSREDTQKHDREMEVLKDQLKRGQATQDVMNQFALDQENQQVLQPQK